MNCRLAEWGKIDSRHHLMKYVSPVGALERARFLHSTLLHKLGTRVISANNARPQDRMPHILVNVRRCTCTNNAGRYGLRDRGAWRSVSLHLVTVVIGRGAPINRCATLPPSSAFLSGRLFPPQTYPYHKWPGCLLFSRKPSLSRLRVARLQRQSAVSLFS